MSSDDSQNNISSDRGEEYDISEDDFLKKLSDQLSTNPEKAIESIIHVDQNIQQKALYKVEEKLGKKKTRKLLVKYANKETTSISDATKAFILSKRHFLAVKILAYDEKVKEAFDLIERKKAIFKNPTQVKINLAKLALQENRYDIVALIASHLEDPLPIQLEIKERIAQVQGRGSDTKVKALESLLENTQPKELILRTLNQVKRYLRKSNLEKSIEILNSTKVRTQKLNKSDFLKDYKELELVLKTLQKWSKARQLLTKNNNRPAKEIYDEILTIAKDDKIVTKYFPAVFFAEAALAFEDVDGNKSESLYRKAAEKTNSTKARERFLVRAQAILDSSKHIQDYVQKTETKNASADICSVCQKKIKEHDKIASCPHCHNKAHYSHLKEWLKVKAVCPICRKHIDELETNFNEN